MDKIQDKKHDGNVVVKVPTFSAGNFIFSRKMDDVELRPLVNQCEILLQNIVEIPILPEAASRLEQDLVRKSIFGTAAIEGNELSEEEVSQVLNAECLQSQERSTKEIINLSLAYRELTKPRENVLALELEETFMKNLHRCITEGIPYKGNEPGAYRNFRVAVGDKAHGGVYAPPKKLVDIQKLMAFFVQWMNSDEVKSLHGIFRAALAHYHFGKIHPFADGNGRTARLLEAILLSAHGFKYAPTMLSNYYYRNLDDYYIAFRISEKDKTYDMTPFLFFVLQGVIESLEEIKSTVFANIRYMVLKQYYNSLRDEKKLTKRQHDLLSILLDTAEVFTKKDLFLKSHFQVLYRRVTERTASRDLIRLKEFNLITQQGAEFRLNFRVI